MDVLNREERQALRHVQAHLHTAMLRAQVVMEQLSTVDVYFHPTNAAPHLNCVMPHRGVAWVRHADLQSAFMALERLGRVPRLIFLDALFPEAFKQQLFLFHLTPEDERVVLVYRPILGPDLPGETPRGRLPGTFPPPISTTVATTPAELATWLRVFRAGYYNTEALTVEPEAVEPLIAAAESGESAFITASYEGTPLGAARLGLQPQSAEIEAAVTAPLWHGMGLEEALIATATRVGLERSTDIIFTIAPPDDFLRLYLRLGFVELTRVTTYWQADEAARISGLRTLSDTQKIPVQGAAQDS